MENPFDKMNNAEKYEFFEEITDKINKFMLVKYPEFDTQLNDKIRLLQSLDKEIKELLKDDREKFIQEKKVCFTNIKTDINKFIAKEYPDIDGRLAMASHDIVETLNKMKNTEKEMSASLKRIFHSASVAKDVYRLRDEFKEFKKEFELFSKKMKALFK